jgi:uncharacterized protein
VGAAEIAAIAAAGMAAGAINTLVGSGTLITFPVLLAFGYSPVTANVSNTIGLVPGSVAGAVGYRLELEGQRTRMLRFAAASAVGGITGAVLLLVLPESAFDAIVPVFIGIALVSIILQPGSTASWPSTGPDRRRTEPGSARARLPRGRVRPPAPTAGAAGGDRGGRYRRDRPAVT